MSLNLINAEISSPSRQQSTVSKVIDRVGAELGYCPFLADPDL